MSEHANCDLGLIGLAVMGQNLVLNMESKGFTVAVFNRTTSVTQQLMDEWTKVGKHIEAGTTLEEFVGLLKKPRKVMIMVKAGTPVDAVIAQLLPLLEKGDIIIDGGNSLFTDTLRREKELKEKGIYYIGCGVSGGEEGALKGPSMMPGGDPVAYSFVEPIFTKISAQVVDTLAADGRMAPCCTYIGPDGAGHYVKMVHNGIEYGDMQLICEAYALLKNVLGLSAAELHDVFNKWNEGDLNSFLIEITTDIFSRIDPDTGQPLVDVILDKAGQKGTGKWTLQSAQDLGIPVSTINAAVEQRIVSSMLDQRHAASKILPGPDKIEFTGDRDAFIQAVQDALYASKIVSYAQGLALIGAASKEYGWNLSVGNIAAIWRGGCIIRAKFLDRITEAYGRDSQLVNLMLDPFFTDIMAKTQNGWREVIATGAKYGIAVPAFSASLGYYDSYRDARGPQNLLQAQRDYFGAHTYERVDKTGTFHTDWFGLDEERLKPHGDVKADTGVGQGGSESQPTPPPPTP
ncbi:6-phosphogluconate dehydrogenase, NADP(+)-dependent, decarboxylating [Abditibacteriota bacterium]|nr:6-phosphogluconate dehydrogenase, NADP(+)-dependent, decarboxylating [Abditibacteriota bacterium]